MKKTYLFALFIFSASLMNAQLLFNEVCYDPSNSGLDGDTNGDGMYNQGEDEFLEIYNSSNTNWDVSGYQVVDDTTTGTVQYVIPNGTLIPPSGVLVIFGGGTPTGNFGRAIVLTDTNGLSLNNSGEVIGLRDSSGNVVIFFDSDALSNNPNESYTRFPDVTGGFIQHGDSTSVLFSPGTMANGISFDTSIVVTTLSVQGMAGADSIATQAGSLQMMTTASPASADDQTVTWSLSNGSANATIDANGLLTAVANGMVTVVATANDALGTSDSIVVLITNQVNGIGEITNEVKVNLYPNPATDVISIETDKRIDLIEVYNLNGQLVATDFAPSNRLDINELKAGSYVLKVRHNSNFSTARFIKK